MTMIVTSRGRTRQPHVHPGIAWGNTLTRGLVFAAEASLGVRNLVNSVSGEGLGSGVSNGTSAHGGTWTFSGTQANRALSFGAVPVLDGTTEATWDVLVYFSSANPTTHFFGQWDSSLKWLLQASGGFLIWVACDDAGGTRARFDSSGVRFPTAGWYRIIASWRGSAGTSLMVNGVVTDRNASGPAVTMQSSSSDYLQLGTVNGGSALSGAIVFARAWRRGLSEAEMRSLHDSPWQLFAPGRRPVNFFGPSTGAGTTVSVPLGAVSVAGYAPTVTATANQTISVPAGAVSLAGYAPTISTSASQTIAVPAGAVSLTGYAPSVFTTAVTTIAVPSGAVSLAGFAPSVSYTTHAYIDVPKGAVTLTGYAPTVTGGESSIWTPVTTDSAVWSAQNVSAATWTPQ